MNTEKETNTLMDQDFNPHFDGLKWTAIYKWAKYEPKLKNSHAKYKVKPHFIH